MSKRDFFSEPYEAPQIEYLLAVVELGFAGSPYESAGGDENGDDDWEQWG